MEKKKKSNTGESVLLVILIAFASVGAIACFILGGIAFFNGRQGTAEQTPATTDQGTLSSSAPTDTSTPETAKPSDDPVQQTSTPTGDPAQAPAANGTGDLGDYHVEINGAALGEDYEGKPIIIITYAWTNNSEETKSALLTVSAKAFQDGVELDTAIVMDSDVYDSGASMKEVRPGTTIDVQCAFVMTSESVVEFELEELISLSGETVSMNFDPTAI